MPASPVTPPPSKEERQAKREARRAKQRAENAGRAAKMHAARLAWELDAIPAVLATVRGRLAAN